MHLEERHPHCEQREPGPAAAVSAKGRYTSSKSARLSLGVRFSGCRCLQAEN